MTISPKEKRLYTLINKSLEHLYDQLAYTQVAVIDKLRLLGHVVSPASLSKIKTGKDVGLPLLISVAKGIQLIMEQELDMAFNGKTEDFEPLDTLGWKPTVVPKIPPQDTQKFTLHPEGRLLVDEKARFIKNATQEIIELGIRLNTLSNYFTNINENAYKTHVINLLKKGVVIKGYLLDPDSNEARIYFDDRSKVQTFEKDSIEDIKKVIARFKVLDAEFKAMNLKGRLEIYLYRHIPNSFYLVVDGTMMETAKMMVSPYLYGIGRANCPVMEFTKKDQSYLFRKHWESLQLFMEGAHQLI